MAITNNVSKCTVYNNGGFFPRRYTVDPVLLPSRTRLNAMNEEVLSFCSLLSMIPPIINILTVVSP